MRWLLDCAVSVAYKARFSLVSWVPPYQNNYFFSQFTYFSYSRLIFRCALLQVFMLQHIVIHWSLAQLYTEMKNQRSLTKLLSSLQYWLWLLFSQDSKLCLKNTNSESILGYLLKAHRKLRPRYMREICPGKEGHTPVLWENSWPLCPSQWVSRCPSQPGWASQSVQIKKN